jgi:predicted porin
MKVRTQISLSVLALAASAASAQSSVTIYGIVDAGVEHLTNVGAGGNGLTRMPNLTGSVPSRIGFRGSEDLGGGLRALFNLETGFSPESGVLNQGGRMFGRQSTVGLQSSWGTFTVGRQNTMLMFSLMDADILGPNIYGSSSLDSYVAGARVDNSIGWRASFSGVTLGATYSLGRDTTNCAGESGADSKACREVSVLAKYDAPAWGVAFAIDQLRGGTGGTGGLTSSTLTDKRSVVNGYFKAGATKVAAGLIRRNNEGSAATPKSDLYWVGASHPVTSLFTLDGQIFRLDFKNSANEATLFALRGTYALSKRTAVYGTLGRIGNDGTLAISASGGAGGGAPAAGKSQTGVMFGVRHAF